ncbi:pyrroloquinoline quinone-dependent dehydrogenase [Pelagibacterium halotolerans]|uniref:Pyrrolo-quinoline quinone n=1 Tax=Pelagibacterium halotolerans (strain DSM 22347 / JCM 15775 / CGMCC 1.7692 / B2) TaxID=1082931 RepID=G4R6M4_PELHB|nr:PQQ-binding-like beta-propeller repeat protein [Pelagibacterium halotolerans]AEQ51220.1 pyrrolo-quinoline quinone [Pelagibacterium halotolerans B2]QJR18917.1 PQQ-binding-like beta-propeller repeat protein [Pelagibacterium halotolerans]SEA68002.1 alcohol dehydrogenase (cytochrome c) [Pelagibacterium halotolerans]
MKLKTLLGVFALGTALVTVSPALAQIEDYVPVSAETLNNPDAGDWLHWRNSPEGWGHSALDQINTDNVDELQLAWGWAMEPGSQQTTPLIYDGVMYIASPGGIVHALDGATGDLLWEYRREMPEDFRPGGITRGLAIFEDKIYYGTPDASLVALDATSGQVVWESVVADHEGGKRITAAPVVADGKVIIGFQGCSRFSEDKCAVVAFDAETGEESWRFVTVEDAEVGEDSWGGTPYVLRGGADVWTSATYDVEQNLILIGVSQPKPWARVSRGQDGPSLYSSSVLALRPENGELAWYRQYVPGESTDADEAFEHMIIEIEGERRYVNMGKLAILWEGSLEDGSPRAAYDLGWQDLIDTDGAEFVDYREGMLPVLNEPSARCPSLAGFRSWRAMSFSPETRAVYVPMNTNCEEGMIHTEVEMAEGGGGNGTSGSQRGMHPNSPDNMGRFAAVNVDTGEVMWEHVMRSPANTSTMTTAGGLVFGGDWDRNFFAFDEETGEVLWKTRLQQAPQGYLASYEVDGRQYIAVPVGVGGASWSTSMPSSLLPEISRPSSGNAIMVFALPETE